MIAALLTVSMFVAQEEKPIDVLKQIKENVQKLDSLQAEISHDFSSGLFPGKYEQTLLVSKDKKFKLIVVVPAGQKRPEGAAYDYYCDGTTLTTLRAEGLPMTATINTDPNVMPGWEVTGWAFLTWMVKTPNENRLFEPPKGYLADFEWGKRESWKDRKVKEIVVTYREEGKNDGPKVNVFVSEDKKQLVGYEWTVGKRTGTLVYTSIKENPKVSNTDFEIPKKP